MCLGLQAKLIEACRQEVRLGRYNLLIVMEVEKCSAKYIPGTINIHVPITGATGSPMLQFCESGVVPDGTEPGLLNRVKRSSTLSFQTLADEWLEGFPCEKLGSVVASDGGGMYRPFIVQRAVNASPTSPSVRNMESTASFQSSWQYQGPR